mgnify:CR=1 FL=1
MLDRRPHANEEGPTLLFQRSSAAHDQRCAGCPFRPVLSDTQPPLTRQGAAILPVPPLTGPGAAPLPGPALVRPPATAGPQTAALPRPSLLALADARGSGTLVLPDALKPAGPDAATVARPVDPERAGSPAPQRNAGPVGYDEMASPDITIMQATALPLRPSAPRARPAPREPDARAYFVLNLCLGVLIVAGLAVLVTRQVAPTPQLLAPGGDHARR